MNGKRHSWVPPEQRATYGVLCVSNRKPAVKITGDDGTGRPIHAGSPFSEGLIAALPYFGAAVGVVLAEILRWSLT
jgi:hypothetical protein